MMNFYHVFKSSFFHVFDVFTVFFSNFLHLYLKRYPNWFKGLRGLGANFGHFLANVNVLRYVCYMLSAVRLSSVCLSVCRLWSVCLSVVCDVGAPYSGG